MPSALHMGMISRSKSRAAADHFPWYTENCRSPLFRAYSFALLQSGQLIPESLPSMTLPDHPSWRVTDA